jgi:hypothetical protein
MQAKKFQPKWEEKYYYVNFPKVYKTNNRDSEIDKFRLSENNCFKTKSEASLCIGDFSPKYPKKELTPIQEAEK